MTVEIEECGTPVKMRKPVRSWSGVLVVTVVMRPDKFSCPYDCYYCPDERKENGAETDQPRSYLSTEPAVARANRNEFDAARQFWSRIDTLRTNGHTINKIEIIVLGGTFTTYPRDYQKEFIRDLFFAANDGERTRERESLAHEQWLNEAAKNRIIGISLETRPDHINNYNLKLFRLYGCTRVQLGIQHTDDDILQGVNRGHNVKTGVDAIKLLKDWGFKVDLHVMPDLPGCTPDMDKEMLTKVITGKEYSPDYLKIYPCLDITFTKIRGWKQDGKWKPYAESDFESLVDVIMHAKRISKRYVRFNRIQRDFPTEKTGTYGYSSDTIMPNLRQIVQQRCKKVGLDCQCIRCREVKGRRIIGSVKYSGEVYEASGGTEYFISASSNDEKTLYGFVRLRLCDTGAFVRELHVYGTIADLTQKKGSVQHNGIGKTLMLYAEATASWNYYSKLKVISGVGVREYYAKLGYGLEQTAGLYMTKEIGEMCIVYASLHALQHNVTAILMMIKHWISYHLGLLSSYVGAVFYSRGEYERRGIHFDRKQGLRNNSRRIRKLYD